MAGPAPDPAGAHSLAQTRADMLAARHDAARATARFREARHVVCESRTLRTKPGDPGRLFMLAAAEDRTRKRLGRTTRRYRTLKRRIDAVLRITKSFLGVPYVWGGAGPGGFDCSGLVLYVYGKLGIHLYHGATMQQRASKAVALHDLQPGDLVFYGYPGYSHHVGIYVGGGRTIHAPHSGAVVSYGSIDGAWTGGRLF